MKNDINPLLSDILSVTKSKRKKKTMTISELIANLENLRSKHGDLDVIINDSEYDLCELEIECEGFYGKNIGREVVKFSRGDYAE